MAIESLHDFSTLTVPELYAVYRAIAQADHRWRIQSFYGDALPPKGHHEFRPLPLSHFQDRLNAARAVSDGEVAFRRQLARQASAYGVDVPAALAECQTVAA